MTELRFTLLSDGSSDRALLPLLAWCLREHLSGCAIQSEWADFARLRSGPRSMEGKVRLALELYPCDLLFIHRDAEIAPRDQRALEIRSAVSRAIPCGVPPVICVVPVRMTEAWLLFDEAAIRRAAGNPHGTSALMTPTIADLESLPDPKRILHELLREASGLSSQRRRRMNASRCALLITRHIDTFLPLRTLTAFTAMEREIEQLVAEQGW